eukprot:GCRY01002067.1.p1 GENE.GCRY01002067.1~~GCRY01002067.1.p1  ORF type:complete len:371 (+),score=87.58 GCRY01002067.1:259-1371(+)
MSHQSWREEDELIDELNNSLGFEHISDESDEYSEDQYYLQEEELKKKSQALDEERKQALSKLTFEDDDQNDFELNREASTDDFYAEIEFEEEPVKPYVVKENTASLQSQYKTSSASLSSRPQEEVSGEGSEYMSAETPAQLSYEDEDEQRTRQRETRAILEEIAPQMGTEATIRYQKARLTVVQEELEKTIEELKKKSEELYVADRRAKEVTEEKERLQRRVKGLSAQADRGRRDLEAAQKKCSELETALASTKKRLDMISRSQKQVDVASSAREARLTRALEDIEKYKKQLEEAKALRKENQGQHRQNVQSLEEENKVCESKKCMNHVGSVVIRLSIDVLFFGGMCFFISSLWRHGLSDFRTFHYYYIL